MSGEGGFWPGSIMGAFERRPDSRYIAGGVPEVGNRDLMMSDVREKLRCGFRRWIDRLSVLSWLTRNFFELKEPCSSLLLITPKLVIKN